MQLGIIGAVLAILLAGGVFIFGGGMNASEEKEAMMQKEAIDKAAMEKDAMMKDEAMSSDDAMQKIDDTMMQKDDAMMQKEAMEKDELMMEKGDAMSHGGTYEAYSSEKIAWAEDGKVVLFFRASWCPTCRAVDSDIRSKLSSIPKNVTILDVNYDTEKALKSKYGVTYQHTFVQVDASGNQIAKWSGSPTLAALVGEVK